MISLHKNKGFTLIELLVVIAIIGILASVVLVSLNSAQNSGTDAATQSNLKNAQTQASVYYNTNNFSFTGICTSTSGINRQLRGAASSTATSLSTTIAAGVPSTVVCNTNGTNWVAAAPLRGGGYWCVDSTGVSARRTAAFASGATACPAS